MDFSKVIPILTIPLAILIVKIIEVINLVLEDWFLWMLLFVLITTDTIIGVVLALANGEFKWETLFKGYAVNIGVFLIGLMILSAIAAGYHDRPGAGTTATFIRDFMGLISSMYFVGKTVSKLGREGRTFVKFMLQVSKRAELETESVKRAVEEASQPTNTDNE
jgi:hypothetical protein